jgi:hypothetical protein
LEDTIKKKNSPIGYWCILVVMVLIIGYNIQNNRKVSIPTVDARTLYSDYKENEVKADLKYKNKTYIITGIIGSVNTDIAKTTYIFISENGKISLLPAPNTDFTNLKVGDTIKVLGRITEFKVDVTIRDCKLIIPT